MLTAFQLNPGIIKDNTELLAEPFWTDADKVRFRAVGNAIMPEVIGGYEDATEQTFAGKCRRLHAWEDLSGTKLVALGTSTKLYLLASGYLWDITPFADENTATDVLTTNATTTVSIADTAHGLIDGATVYLHNATTLDGVDLGVTATLSTDPFSVTENDTLVVVTHSSHGLATGDVVIFASATATGGVSAGALNTTHTIQVLDASTYVIEVADTATSTTTGGGTPGVTGLRAYTVTVTDADNFTVTADTTASGSTAGGGGTLTYKYEVNPGLETTATTRGYSTGTYSSGGYSSPSTESDLRARIWTLTNFGQNLVANYKESALYRWQNRLSARAAVNGATDAPAKSLHHVVTPERFVMCLGTEDAATSTFDPMLVAWATQEGGFTTNDWTPTATNTAGDFRLAEGTRIVAGLPMPFVTLIWTDTAVYQAQYLRDSTFVWGFQALGTGSGLIGSNAVARATDGAVYWLSSNREFMVWRGGTPQVVPCPVRDFFFDNLERPQTDLIYAGLNDKFNEIWWFYPTSTENENASYVAYNYLEGHWTVGTFPITAWVERGVNEFPAAAHSDGTVKLHERGPLAENGNSVTAHIESGLFDIADGETHAFVRRMVPDFAGLEGSVDVSIISRFWPSDSDTTTSAGTVDTSTEKLDFRVSARHLGVKLQSSTVPNAWRLGRLLLDVMPTNRKR